MMSRALDNQWRWLDDLAFLDGHWAETEFRLREDAVALSERALHPSMGGAAQIVVPHSFRVPSFVHPGDKMPEPTFDSVAMEILVVGGKEQVLLIEECLRRAYAGIGW